MAALGRPLREPETIVKVLFVSHMNENQSELKRILARTYWQLEEASSFKNGLRRLSGEQFPVTFCEHELPDGNWRKFLRIAIGRDFVPRVVVCSRVANDSLWAEVLNLGGFDVLSMPFEVGEVLSVLCLALDSWQRERNRTANWPRPVPLEVAGRRTVADILDISRQSRRMSKTSTRSDTLRRIARRTRDIEEYA